MPAHRCIQKKINIKMLKCQKLTSYKHSSLLYTSFPGKIAKNVL